MSGGTLLQGLRQPEYTGENRCLPCTTVNVAITAVLAGLAGLAGASYWGPTAGVLLAAVVAVPSLLSIYLRGYLVPGTPELTKRYFPPWLLKLFGKEPAMPAGHEQRTGETSRERHERIDVERRLMDAGAVAECEDRDDLCLTDEFRSEWHDALDGIDDADRDQLLAVLDVDEGSVEFEEFGRAFRATIDGQKVGTWESRGAFLADLAAARVFEDQYDEWDGLSVRNRSRLVSGLRLFIDVCPECGGVPTLGTSTVESCCSTREVAAVTCEDCDARLLETGAPV
ncbi:MAG: hypothetical protein ABEH35_06985 [Haloarculaceae archaeon]